MNVVDSDSSSNVRHEVVVLQGNVLCSWSEVMASSHCNARLIVFPYLYLAVKVWFVDVERKDLIHLFNLRQKGDDFSIDSAMNSASAVLRASSLFINFDFQ